MNALHPVPVVAAIIWDGPRFLAAERPAGKVQAGLWEFPGGKILPGEPKNRALYRELDEELGIRPVSYELWQERHKTYEHIRVHLFFYHVWSYAGQVRAREGQTLEWLTATEAARKPFLEADTKVIADLLSFVKSHDFCM